MQGPASVAVRGVGRNHREHLPGSNEYSPGVLSKSIESQGDGQNGSVDYRDSKRESTEHSMRGCHLVVIGGEPSCDLLSQRLGVPGAPTGFVAYTTRETWLEC